MMHRMDTISLAVADVTRMCRPDGSLCAALRPRVDAREGFRPE
jgi:hypothetical protein